MMSPSKIVCYYIPKFKILKSKYKLKFRNEGGGTGSVYNLISL